MKISLITVSYNSEDTIEDTFRSVVAQKGVDIEYIVIDGSSTDATLEIVKKYEDKIDVFLSEKDNGIYDAMNKGIQLASGELIGILNSDDVFSHDEVLLKVANAFLDSTIDGLYGDLVYVDRFDLDKVKRKWVAKPYNEGAFLKGWMPPHPTFYIRKQVYENYGLFNLDFISAADYEIMLRFIHKFNIKLAYLPEVMVKMRQGGQSNASLLNRIKANREDKRAWEVNGLKPGKLTLLQKPLSKVTQFLKR